MSKNKPLIRYINALASLCYRGDKTYYYAVNNPKIKKEELEKLLATWGITDSMSLRERMKWYLEVGVREEFNKLLNLLSTFSEENRINYIQSLVDDQLKLQLMIVHNNSIKLSKGTIAAYDYGSYIYLCNLGQKMKYLTADEAWGYMIEAARKVQRMYKSWDEYLYGYTIGAQFSNSESAKEYLQENKAFFIKMIASKHSPMNNVDWDQPI